MNILSIELSFTIFSFHAKVVFTFQLICPLAVDETQLCKNYGHGGVEAKTPTGKHHHIVHMFMSALLTFPVLGFYESRTF